MCDDLPRLRPANPAEAFHVISDTEDTLVDLEGLAWTIDYLKVDDPRVMQVLVWLSREIRAKCADLEAARVEAFDLLHQCAYPDRLTHNDDGGAS